VPAGTLASGISNIASCTCGSNAVALEDAHQILLRQLDAADQRVERRFGLAGGVVDGIERAPQVVGDRQQVAGKCADRVLAGFFPVALGAAPGILHFRQGAQILVLEADEFGLGLGQQLGGRLLIRGGQLARLRFGRRQFLGGRRRAAAGRSLRRCRVRLLFHGCLPVDSRIRV
jgi:hypothetical protein